jgi:hypothetical protein
MKERERFCVRREEGIGSDALSLSSTLFIIVL